VTAAARHAGDARVGSARRVTAPAAAVAQLAARQRLGHCGADRCRSPAARSSNPPPQGAPARPQLHATTRSLKIGPQLTRTTPGRLLRSGWRWRKGRLLRTPRCRRSAHLRTLPHLLLRAPPPARLRAEHSQLAGQWARAARGAAGLRAARCARAPASRRRAPPRGRGRGLPVRPRHPPNCTSAPRHTPGSTAAAARGPRALRLPRCARAKSCAREVLPLCDRYYPSARGITPRRGALPPRRPLLPPCPQY
jgi:hypothetical protein